MPITEADLKHFLSEVVGSGATNGGRMSEVEAVDSVKNNVWPNVSAQERASGLTLYRKLFGSPRNVGSEALSNVKLWLHAPTPGDDYVYLFAGTKTDTEADFSQTTKYASGNLKADLASGQSSCVVVCENAATTLGFHANGIIRLSEQDSPDDTGTYEEITLNGTTPLVNGLEVTLYFDGTNVNAFTAADTKISAVMEIGDIEAATGTIVVTSASGTVDESGFPPVCYNKGTRDETLTVTFSTTTAFSVTGSRSGALGSGTISTDFVAVNPINGSTLITLPTGFFSGSGWVALNTVVIPTIGCNFAYWEARIIPADCDSLNGNEAIVAYTGESG